jgi:uncharacterized protein YbbC (DUF1343 family)
MHAQRTTLGIERLLAEEFHLVEGKRLGLITNQSGVDSRLRATADLLHRAAGVRLEVLFGPEHGIRGAAADGAAVDNCRDPRTGLPVHSLYGAARQPHPSTLAGLDVLVFDIQDVGARFYTYLYTMSLAMQAAATQDLPFLVLDRPNPVGGLAVEGKVLDPAFASFVGLYPIPIRYGMTVGELAGLFNEAFSIGVRLEVVRLRGWHREHHWEDTGLPWVPPSPNMPTVDTAVVYPGMCLFEGTNLSEGRGTTKPFEQVGAPFVEAHSLTDQLEELGLPGVRFRPVHFQPAAGKHAGRLCQGVQVHVLDRTTFPAVRVGLEVLAAIRRTWPADFAWHVPQTDTYNFDRLAGTDRIRLALDAGVPVAELMADWEDELAAFAALRDPYLLYRD